MRYRDTMYSKESNEESKGSRNYGGLTRRKDNSGNRRVVCKYPACPHVEER